VHFLKVCLLGLELSEEINVITVMFAHANENKPAWRTFSVTIGVRFVSESLYFELDHFCESFELDHKTGLNGVVIRNDCNLSVLSHSLNIVGLKMMNSILLKLAILSAEG